MGTAVATEWPKVEPSSDSFAPLAIEAREVAYNPDRRSGGSVGVTLEHFHDSGRTVLRLTANGHVMSEEGEYRDDDMRVKLVLRSPDAVRALTSCLLELLQNERAMELLEALRPDDCSG